MGKADMLGFLWEQFARVHAKLDALQRTQNEHGHRLTAIEIGMSRVRRDVAGDAEAVAMAGAWMDGIEDRLMWIERRLDIADAG